VQTSEKKGERGGIKPERIEYKEAHAPLLFLLFGSHETSPIMWIGKPAPAIKY
jgi:hypothetical protein